MRCTGSNSPRTFSMKKLKVQLPKKLQRPRRRMAATFLNFSDLPRAVFFFPSMQPAATTRATNFHFFSLLPGQGEGCVMFADPDGIVTVYDAEMNSAFPMRPVDFCKPANSITLSITNQPGCGSRRRRRDQELYVMSTEDGSFENFMYYRTGSLSAFQDDWRWALLPHVRPFVPYNRTGTAHATSPPFAAALVNSSTICASSKEGTYTFDMLCEMWLRSGRWTLPFHGAAEYVPSFRRWFALEDPKSSQHRLCAFNLASLKAQDAPATLHAWDYLDGLPHGWCASERRLVNLGMGKFCITTHFFRRPSPEKEDDVKEVRVVNNELTVLTGVEVVRTKGGLEMIRHKSRHYSTENMGIHCVL